MRFNRKNSRAVWNKSICVAALLVWGSVFHAGAQAKTVASYHKPFTFFRVIATGHFDIIFPKESEPSARLLATYADNIYDQVSALLGIEVPSRIPVIFAPHMDMFNGYMNPIPRPHIVLFDTPMDLEWTNFADSLESLFLHELTHAVSLSSRSRFYRGLNRVFGTWASPTLINTPQFMVEGITVSFESLTGFGRANDPLIKQKLRQALYEEKFATPFQASGVYDFPGQNGIWYEYGGLFSAWLQQNYGMEKYAELWQAMGGDSGFSFFVYRSGYYRLFKKVYGIDFLDAWKTFSASLALDGLEENPQELLPKQYRFFSEKSRFIDGVAAGGNSVYAIDSGERKLRVYDTRTGKVRTRNIGAVAAYDLDVSADGANVLVSGYNLAGERYFAAVTEHGADTGWKTGRTIRGLYKARYFRDGVIGIRSELHNTCVVYEDFYGKHEVLFRGNEKLLFSGPQAVDDERIAFIAAREGIRELWLYNYVSRELFRVEDSTGGSETGNGEYWRYMRSLGVSEGKLFFSHNADDRMYKLAVIDMAAMEAVFSSKDFSGGVFNPVSVNGAVYYRGSFFSRDGLLRFPEATNALSGKRRALRLAPLHDPAPEGKPQNIVRSETARTEPHTADESLNIVRGESEQTDQPGWTEPSGSEVWQTKPYITLRYMNPFQFWLPLPLLRFDTNFSLDGAGLISVMVDPTDRNVIRLMAFADIAYRMAMVDSFSWQNTSMGFPLTLEFSDKVIASGDTPYRDTRGSLSGSLLWNMGRWFQDFSLGGLYACTADDNGGPSAYEWEETNNVFAIFTGFAFSNRQRRLYELFGTGLYFGFRGISVVDSFEPRLDGIFSASVETRFPLRINFYGAYDQQGMNLHGVSRRYGEPLFAKTASTEYSDGASDLTWLAGGEAALGLFSFEIQRNLSHFYFNRFFGSLAIRSVLYDSKDNPDAEGIAIDNMRLAQSAVLKFNLVSSIIPLKQVPFFIEPNIWGAWKFSNTITGKGFPWYASAGVEIRF